MSRDQKPGRMRIIAGGGQPPQPQRRAGDKTAATSGEMKAEAKPEGSAPAEQVADPKKVLLGSILFLTCCAAGAVGVTVAMGAAA